MSDEADKLQRAARQLIETDRLLAGDTLAPGVNLPEPEPVAAAAAPAPGANSQPVAPPDRVPLVELDLTTDAAKAKAAELDAIDVSEGRPCTKCGLCQTRTHTVFGEGHPDADIFFIGEGPGADEDLQGRPFVGRAGELLTKMIGAMGLTRGDIYIGNVVKCRPPDNRAPAADEAAACWSYLQRQLTIIQPRVIITMGNPATHAILRTTTGITRLRGQWQSLPVTDPALASVKVMPTFHPAYLLRSYTPANRKAVWSDLQAVMAELGMKRE